MSDWRSISRDDLLKWVETESAPQRLPQLLRRLVLETGGAIEVIDVAEGRGVLSGGLDGFVKATQATAHIPAGVSVWELSIESDYSKADRDYDKRLTVPDGTPTNTATYVEVIARPWVKRAEWAKSKTATGRWREVRGYNVDQLATWLEQAPATRVWFAEQFGLPVTGLWSATEWWGRWTTATEPELTPEHVLARPKEPIDVLRAELTAKGVTTVGGPLGRDELIAIVVAVALSGAERMAAPFLVVDSRDAWQRLLDETSPLILVATDPEFARDVDPSTPHSVIVPIMQATEADVLFDPVDPDSFSSAIREADANADYELCTLAHRSFVAFRRRIAKRRELMRPAWAESPPPRPVRAAVLLTSWSDRNAQDRAVIESFAGTNYSAVRDALLPYTAGDDPLLALAGDIWHVVSPVDAATQLARWFLRDDMELLVTAAKSVLGELDPQFDIPIAERWRASVDGTTLQHSQQLRNGIATSLAVIGAFGDTFVRGTGRDGEDWAGAVTYKLLEDANRDGTGRRWASLSSLLPLLAEASPRLFLDAVRDASTADDPVAKTMFQDGTEADSFRSGWSPHTGLLWAIEGLAWPTEYFTDAVQLLAMLAVLDPGGRLNNRPQESLNRIFCSWHPETAADAGRRVDALDQLSRRWPEVAWRLLMALLPERMGGAHFPTHAPEFRDWKPIQQPVLVTEYWAFVESVVDRLLALVDADSTRWRELLDDHDGLSPQLRSRIRERLAGVAWSDVPEADKSALWEFGRGYIAKHREYADAQWSLPELELAELEQSFEVLAPTDPSIEHAWLFSSGWVSLGDVKRRDDVPAYEEELAARRLAALREIHSDGGLEAVKKFAEPTEHGGFVGTTLAELVADQYLDPLLGELASPSEGLQRLARSYLWKLCRERGLDWVKELIDGRTLTDYEKAILINFADDFVQGTELVGQLGDGVEREYWLNFSYLGLGDFRHVKVVAENLIKVDRLAGALDFLSIYAKDGDDPDYAQLFASALEAIINAPQLDPLLKQLRSWGFERAFTCMDRHVEVLGTERVTRIEWYFFPVLGYFPQTTHLHRRLALDPAFFNEIVCLVYRSREEGEALADGDSSESADSNHGPWENAWRLLGSWHVPPGTLDNGSFDIGACTEWIADARLLLNESDRLEVGEQHVGSVLTYTPQDDDAEWPSQAVRELIEHLDSRDVERGFHIEMINRRGTTSRSLTEGGDQERVIAKEHKGRAERFASRWPRTSAIFAGLAKDFESQARMHDAEAEHRRRGLDR